MLPFPLFCAPPPPPPPPGYGSVVQMYPGDAAVRPAVESFGFPPHFQATLHEFPISRVNALLAGTPDCPGAPANKEGGAAAGREEGGRGGIYCDLFDQNCVWLF